jgi:uncharacterized protein YpmB
VKTILILCIVILVLLLAVFLLFKAWRKNVQKYKDEHERAERLRYQVELAQNETRIKKEVFDEAEKEKHKTDGLSGRDRFDAITDSLRDDD